MTPPTIGSEVDVIRTGTITRYNDDNTANVKLKPGRGRPNKVPFDKFHTPAVIPQPEPSKSTVKRNIGWTGLVIAAIAELKTGFIQAGGSQIFELLLPLFKGAMKLIF